MTKTQTRPLPLPLTTLIALACLGAVLAALALTPGPAAGDALTAYATPVGGKSLGASGGVYACDVWTLTVPANVAPDRSTVHCGGFNPNLTPRLPAEYKSLRHTINVHIYNDWGSWITQFNPNLTLCYPYTAADIAAAGGNAANLVIMTSPAPPYAVQWTTLPTEIYTDKQQVCAKTNHLTLFEVAVSSSVVSKPGATTSGATGCSTTTYSIRPGDTLFRIARRYNITVAALKAANGLTSNLIYPAQVLKIPGNCAGPTATPAKTPVPTPSPTPARTYTVQLGDTLYAIAGRYGVTVAAIRTANKLTSYWIYVGQVLIIP